MSLREAVVFERDKSVSEVMAEEGRRRDIVTNAV